MPLTSPIKDGDWRSVRQAISKLSMKLGPTSEPTFAGLTLTDLTATHVLYAGTDGVITGDANLTWASDVLAVAGTVDATTITDGDLTITTGDIDGVDNIRNEGGIIGHYDTNMQYSSGNWLGLGSAKGRLIFTDAAKDYLALYDADFNIAGGTLTVSGGNTVLDSGYGLIGGTTGGTAGYDVIVYGDTDGKYVQWDQANDQLNVVGTVSITGDASIVGDLTGLTSLVVDNITLDGATIVSDTGAISFNNEILSTTGSMGIGQVANANRVLNIFKAGTTYYRGCYASVSYYGTNLDAIGAYFQVFGGANNANASNIGGRFESQCYYYGSPYNVPTGENRKMWGGEFKAFDRSGQDYQSTGTGYYEFVGGKFAVNNASSDWTTYNPIVNAYGIVIAAAPTGYGTNLTYWSIYSTGGDSFHSGDIAFGQTDKAERIGSDADGTLDLYAGTSIDLHQATTIDSILTLDKSSGMGIKVDTATPTFGWRDLVGKIRKRGVGATDPADAVYIGGSVKAWQFAVNDEVWLEFHIPHDYVAGTDIHLHFHWSHNSAIVTGGNVTWGAYITYAKGHNQAAFSVEVNPTITPDASTTQYQHMVSEVQISAGTPGATQIDTDDIEPDGLVLVHIYLSANNITSSGAVPDPFLHEVDVHYQSTNIATKAKVPDFYT